MKTYRYVVRKFNSPNDGLNGKVIATTESENERNAWLGVLQLAKDRNMTFRVFADSGEYRGIVYPDGRTESFLAGY